MLHRSAIPRPRLVFSTLALALLTSSHVMAGGVPFDTATVTVVEKKVSVGEVDHGEKSLHAATVSEVIKVGNYLQTATESRSELEFPDHSIVRVGQNSIFAFEGQSRTLSLQKGTMLFYVPHGAGGGVIKTPSMVASITGTLGKVSEHMIAVLRGQVKVTVRGCDDKASVDKEYTVDAGWALEVVDCEVHLFKFDPSEATNGKLYSLGGKPMPDDPDFSVLPMPDFHDIDVREITVIDPRVNESLKVKPPLSFPTVTATATATPTASVTPTATATPTPVPTATATPIPTATASPSASVPTEQLF